jgi:cysteine-rich repeat protein
VRRGHREGGLVRTTAAATLDQTKVAFYVAIDAGGSRWAGMRNLGLAAYVALGLVAACTPNPLDLDFGGDDRAEAGGGEGGRDGGIRILSDALSPGRVDTSSGHDAEGGGVTRDAGAESFEDRRSYEDAATVDIAGDAASRGDGHGSDAPTVLSDAAGGGDARSEMDARGEDDVVRAQDSGDERDAGIVLGTCNAVRACARTDVDAGEGCLRAALPAARAPAEPVLSCESSACAASCRGASTLAACNACLLHACFSALVACAKQSGCGDGVVIAETEECDDGNTDDHDACNQACARARCGDGLVWDGREACDDGNADDTDACLGSCQRAACGDGIVWIGVEGCDDGNQRGGDGCSATCLIESCGNGIVDPGEECDQGAANREDGACLPTCRVNRCGDGRICSAANCGVELGTVLEACDDHNDVDTDACVKGCRLATCGDGYLRDGVEMCDDGNDDRFDNCGDCATPAAHLLVTEIVTRPAGAEMIEILNPTRSAVLLADYALSDSHLYFEVTAGAFTTASGSDFAARFPDGATLEPGHYAVVTLGNASGGSQSFASIYGKAPDFELRPTANQATDDATVPNMVPMGGASIGAGASLTDGGEPIVLFFYGGGDRVFDVDYVFYGAPSASNSMIDKTGVVRGAWSYLADTPPAAQHAVAAPGDTGSIHRCVYAESHETTSLGNGIAGHDETSEDASVAFRLGGAAGDRTPGGPPPAALCAK